MICYGSNRAFQLYLHFQFDAMCQSFEAFHSVPMSNTKMQGETLRQSALSIYSYVAGLLIFGALSN